MKLMAPDIWQSLIEITGLQKTQKIKLDTKKNNILKITVLINILMVLFRFVKHPVRSAMLRSIACKITIHFI